MIYFGFIYDNSWIISTSKNWNDLIPILELNCQETILPLNLIDPKYPKIGDIIEDENGNRIEILNIKIFDYVKKVENVSGANELNILLLRSDRKKKLKKIHKISYDKE